MTTLGAPSGSMVVRMATGTFWTEQSREFISGPNYVVYHQVLLLLTNNRNGTCPPTIVTSVSADVEGNRASIHLI